MELLEKHLLPFAILALTAYAYGWPDPRAWYWSVTLAAALAFVIIARTLPERKTVFAPPVVPKEVWRFGVRRIFIPLMTILLALLVLLALNRADGASPDAARTLAMILAVYAIFVASADPSR
jgi:hypothetical protein